eukprot:s3061_g5.t1
MTTATKDEDKVRLERFDGTEPAVYKRWRRKAELMLLALPTTFEKTRWGPKLCEFISGEAEELVEHLTVEELCKEDGYQKVFEALDEKYQKRKQEEAQTYLREYFYKSVIKQGETYRQFIVRLETTYRHLTQHNITLPDEVKGWLLLKKLCLDGTQEALVLTAAGGSLKYKEITEAIYKVMPEGKCTSSTKAKDVFIHEGYQHEVERATESLDETEDDVFEALADYAQDEGADYEDALDVYEAYQEIRKRVQTQKMARGFKSYAPPPLRLTGHWKRECPRKDSRKSATFGKASGKASGKKEEPNPRDGHDSMVADYEQCDDNGTLMSHDARELSASQSEVFFSEQGLADLEALLVQQGSESSTVQAGGALAKAEFSEVFESHFGNTHGPDSEAYMPSRARSIRRRREAEKKKTVEQMPDQARDLQSDEQGDAERMKDSSLQTGKYKDKMFGETYTGKYKDKMFGETYVEKKDYINWIRKNVTPDNSKFSLNMLEFRLYIEARDHHKLLRMKKEKAEKEAVQVSTPTPRRAAQRRSNMECDWEEVMQPPTIPVAAETQSQGLTADIQDLQEKLESINQVIQTATHHKMIIENQVKDLVSRAAK